MTSLLVPGAVGLDVLERIYREGGAVRLDPGVRDRIRAAAARVAEIAVGEAAHYGINTGFGKLAGVRVPPGDTGTLQRNLILSVAAASARPCRSASPGWSWR